MGEIQMRNIIILYFTSENNNNSLYVLELDFKIFSVFPTFAKIHVTFIIRKYIYK